jgi:2'-hydroxyisoflavone reductase
MQRRSFLKNSIYAAMMVATGHTRVLADGERKRILILGGTHFLGPAVVEAALAGRHTVALFNRGVSSPELFPYVEKLRGFRSANSDDQNLSALGKRHWDAVIDVWPNDPALAESAARLLKDRTNHYLYISSIGAYDEKDFAQPNLSEDAPLSQWVGSGSSYSRGKAESERRLHEIIGERLTVVRPGAIKGFRDTTPDLLGWLRRLQSGKSVIAPGDGTDPVEIVDVKDVADFLVLAIDRTAYGTFNLTGKRMSFREFLEGCKSATYSDAELVWIPEAFLHEQGLAPQNLANWLIYFPYWHPQPSGANWARISSQKAFAAGWGTRPFRNTALDYLAYIASLSDYPFTDTLPPSKQEEALNLWRRRKQ